MNPLFMRQLVVRNALVIAAVLAVIVAAPAQADLTQQAELTAAMGGADQLLGAGVAISGDTMAVAAPFLSVGSAGDHGAIYVFERPASGWRDAKQVAVLTPTDGRVSSVAISGDTIAAGNDSETVAGKADQGAVDLFVKPGLGWKDAHETVTLRAFDGRANDLLGRSVAISGDTVAAGAPNALAGKSGQQGKVYVFVKPPEFWMNQYESARLSSSDLASGARFGASVATSGDIVVAGAPDHAVAQNELQGTAFVFVKPAAGWTDATESAALSPSDGAAADHFGASVAIAGDTAAVGSPNHKSAQGAAYVFSKPAAGWSGKPAQTAELSASDGARLDGLAVDLAVSGDTVVAGAVQRGMVTNPNAGAAYVFVKPGGGWGDATEVQKVTAADGAGGDNFGSGVALSRGVAVVGAPSHAAGGNARQGAAYVFGTPPSIAIGAPADGASFTLGDSVNASYACAAAAGGTVASCVGPVPSGALVDTSSLGTHTFTVDAWDGEGTAATKSVSYKVVAKDTPPPPPPPGAPSITALKQSRAAWRERGRKPLGTTFSFRLDQPARVALRFTRRGKSAGVLGISAHIGLNRVPFRGRISPKKELPPGRYMLRLTATNPAGKSASSRQLRFAIVTR